MKKAIINVHGNTTLSRIVQGLAFKDGYSWAFSSGNLTEKEDAKFLCFGTWADKHIRYTSDEGYVANEYVANGVAQILDAATEFDKVIAFFEQPQRPVIKVGEHTVEWSDDNKTIKVGRTVVPAETVKAIHDELFKK